MEVWVVVDEVYDVRVFRTKENANNNLNKVLGELIADNKKMILEDKDIDNTESDEEYLDDYDFCDYLEADIKFETKNEKLVRLKNYSDEEWFEFKLAKTEVDSSLQEKELSLFYLCHNNLEIEAIQFLMEALAIKDKKKKDEISEMRATLKVVRDLITDASKKETRESIMNLVEEY